MCNYCCWLELCDAGGYRIEGDDSCTGEDIACRLRLPIKKFSIELEQLRRADLLVENDKGMLIASIAGRQGRTDSEKRRHWREQKIHQRLQRGQLQPPEGDVSADMGEDMPPRTGEQDSNSVLPLELEEIRAESEVEEEEVPPHDGDGEERSLLSIAHFNETYGKAPNKAQRKVLNQLEAQYDPETLSEVIEWVVIKGISPLHVIQALKTALPKWED